MQVAIKDIQAKMSSACHYLGVPREHIDLVVSHFLDGELYGTTTHGITKFCFESQFFGQRQNTPKVVRDLGPVAVVDANREIGPISAHFATDLVIQKALEYGIGLVGMNNSQRYGILSTWSEQIATKNLLGIVMNTSQPDASVYGATSPILGVNPLSYSIPAHEDPLTLDMSTTILPMGYLWECRRNNEKLEPCTFLDEHGEYTTDPFAAISVEIFGGYKGFAVSLLIQVLTGALFGFPMGQKIETFWDTGYCFIAIDPAKIGNPSTFDQQISDLAKQIRETATRGGIDSLRLPGEVSRKKRAASLFDGYIDIPEKLYERVCELAQSGQGKN